MRITSNMMAGNLVRRLNNNSTRVQKYQDQLSAAKRITKPSDDPIGLTASLRLRSTLVEMDRYKQNMEESKDWLTATSESLNKMGEVIHRLHELAVAGASSTVPQPALDAMANEVDQMHEYLVDLANSDHGGRYLFAGQNTLTAPFTLGGPAGALDNGAILREIARGQVMQINTTPQFLANPGSILKNVQNLANELRAGNYTGVSNLIGSLQANEDEILAMESAVGAKINRLEMSAERSLELQTSVTRLLSETEDADIAELTVRLGQEEAAYRAALTVGARLIQPTLADFLR
ncbi:MAG: flagellar hook-associated protein FlgL [Firmicutes bacterium]|nr:flagellar hook-associated protein FlgL [Bacillota bacterium]